jgi:hypothetical protein
MLVGAQSGIQSQFSVSFLRSRLLLPSRLSVLYRLPLIAISAATNMGEGFALVNSINQIGLFPYTSGVTDFDLYIAGNPRHTSAPGSSSSTALSRLPRWPAGAVRSSLEFGAAKCGFLRTE